MRMFRALVILVSLSLPAAALAELRTYDVDAKYRQEVYQALRGVLQERPQPIASIERLPTGQLLIDATEDVHRQIEAILDAVASREATAAPQVTLRYWAVLGTANAPDDPSVPAILGNVLDEIQKTHGDLGFRVLGSATLVTESGQSGKIEGDPLTIKQQTYAEDTTLNAQIRIEFVYPFNVIASSSNVKVFQTRQLRTQTVELKTTLQSGEFVVLGENTLGENTIEGKELHGTVFYIVHWPAEQ